MANPNDLEILCQGAKVWNAWRDDNPGVVPDLTDANLTLGQRQFGPTSGGPVNLRGVNLSGAALRYATLSGADLEDAVLAGADLVHARLDGANMTGADLTDATCDNADLARAKFDEAVLTGASFANARNLTQDQIAFAYGDATTLLPAAIVPPAAWFAPVEDTVYPEFTVSERMDEDLYDVLGVTPTAKPEDIRTAFRNLVKKLHPDVNPDDVNAQDSFKRVSTAYRVLGDAEKRARYDKGEIGSDGEINPEFEANRQFRRTAFRFYTAAAMALLLAVGVLGVVWHAVLTNGGAGSGRVEIAVDTPPKNDERLDTAPSDLKVDFRRRPQMEIAEGGEDAGAARTEILHRPEPAEDRSDEVASSAVQLPEADPDAGQPERAPMDAQGDAAQAKPAEDRSDEVASSAAQMPEADPNAGQPERAPMDAEADAAEAKPAEDRADEVASSAAQLPEAEAGAGQPERAPMDAQGDAPKVEPARVEPAQVEPAQVEPADTGPAVEIPGRQASLEVGPATNDLTGSRETEQPAETISGAETPPPLAEQEAPPALPDASEQPLASAWLQPNQLQDHGATPDSAPMALSEPVVQNLEGQSPEPASASQPPGTDAPPAVAPTTSPDEAKVTTRPLFEDHEGTKARPAQADAAREGAPSAETAAARASGPAGIPFAERAQPARSDAFLRKAEDRRGASDAISALFRQRAVKQAFARDEQQATASMDPPASPEDLDGQAEIRDIFTHSVPGAGPTPADMWPEFPKAAKTPHREVRRRPSNDGIGKVPAREDRPASANRKQAVSDILAGGL